MTVDLELSFNRFGFGMADKNKLQLGPLRISWWALCSKHSISFEISWIRES